MVGGRHCGWGRSGRGDTEGGAVVGGETLRVGPKWEGDPEDVLCRAVVGGRPCGWGRGGRGDTEGGAVVGGETLRMGPWWEGRH